jgi:hypothetical protein
MKKQHSKNWGGSGRGQGRKPRCGLCKLLVTKEQLALGDAFHFSDGNYYHQECLSDQMRLPDDAYYRDESGKQPNRS